MLLPWAISVPEEMRCSITDHWLNAIAVADGWGDVTARMSLRYERYCNCDDTQNMRQTAAQLAAHSAGQEAPVKMRASSKILGWRRGRA